jgi:hypothetical protein
MDSSLAEEAMVWGAVASEKVTLSELETVYSLDDLERLLAFLAFQADVAEAASNESRERSRNGVQ